MVNNIMGYIAVCVALILYSSPFLKIRDVVKYKTGVFIPIYDYRGHIQQHHVDYLHAHGWIVVPPRDQRLLCGFRSSTANCVHPSKHPLGYGATLEALVDNENGYKSVLSISVL
ncbi:unnamed protein product [Phytophthora lilii]|uniref:Unnamed protein product n=1 Tax=Phytophthora lilii TaxID=2077276 RepID=A0A9W6XDA1_9STRA|nr:unnamed protein product [Phytophthora lilii]